MSYDRYQGTKYEQGRDTAEIAKLFRGDVKAAVAAGELPKGLKLSVRVSRYSGGSSINVHVKACPGVSVINPGHVLANEAIPYKYVEDMRIRHMYTDAGRALLAKLEALLEAYNRCESDLQSDYYNTKFYAHVSFHSELTRAERAAVVAELVELIPECKIAAQMDLNMAIRQCVAIAVGPIPDSQVAA
jgi:hypothetical protein